MERERGTWHPKRNIICDHLFWVICVCPMLLCYDLLFDPQIGEEDSSNQCKDWENGTRHEDQRGSENRGIRHVQDQLPWP